VEEGDGDGFASQSSVAALAATIPSAAAQAVRDMPHQVLCAFKDKWHTPGATITYDSFLVNHSNTNCSGCGSGGLDLATGIFTCTAAGHYTVTFSCYAQLATGQGIWLNLHLNDKEVPESKWRYKVAKEGDGAKEGAAEEKDGGQEQNIWLGDWVYTQGSRTVVSHHL
jgi:hypothetical protein